MEDSLELVISDWEGHEGDPRILPLLRELDARRRAAESWTTIAEYAKATVPYIENCSKGLCTMNRKLFRVINASTSNQRFVIVVNRRP